MFDEKSLRTLEYPKFLAIVGGYAMSESGRQRILNSLPTCDFEEAERELNKTEEADKVLYDYATSPNFAVDDLSEVLFKASKGFMLSIGELLMTARLLRASRNLKVTINSISDVPLLSEIAFRLYGNEGLETSIFESFISENEVADCASDELRAIRQKIRRINENIRTKLQSYITSPKYSKCLQDGIITMRDNRYVIPLKSDFKGSIAGIVHDQSASGSTLYVEPMYVVEMNNDLSEAKVKERLEIERIIRRFSTQIASVSENISESYEAIVEADCVFARAKFAREYKCEKPELNKDRVIDIVEGRHPLIDRKKVVPVSLYLKKEDKMLLITGSNTGGKTVTLKLVGLFTLMALSGFFLPCKRANIGVFDGVYSDIGDEQSIEQSLSTFSAHVKNVIGVLDNMSENSLVLLDELGSGTDPGEGAPLAVSIAEYLINEGVKSLITSHFNDLKEFALVTKGVAVASMEFDVKTLSPTFRLIMGAVGNSNALLIAKNLGLKESIVERAKSKVSVNKLELDSVLLAAEETRQRAETLSNEAEKDRQLAKSVLKEAEQEKKVILEKKEKLDERIRKETKSLISDNVAEADDLLEQIKELLKKNERITKNDLFEAYKIKKKIENIEADYVEVTVDDNTPDETPLNVGDSVYIKSLGKRGKLVSVSLRGEATVTVGKLSLKVKHGDYYKVRND